MNDIEEVDLIDAEPTAPHVAPISSRQSQGRLWIALAAFILIVLVAFGAFAYFLPENRANSLYPPLPAFTASSGTTDYQVHQINFNELNDNPAQFQNQRLQTTGVYTPLPAPGCMNYSGPNIRWSLVADELLLNAVGFEDLLKLVNPGIELTVVGTWRYYHGPLGCGKEPADQTLWYLEVDRILEPNPLLVNVNPALTVVIGTPGFPALSDPIAAPQEPQIGKTPSITTTDVFNPTPTGENGLPLTPTAPLMLTPTSTLATTPLIPSGSATLEGTPGAQSTPSATNQPGTPGAGGTPPPSIPTSTPSGPGYPSQPQPSTPTPGGGYP